EESVFRGKCRCVLVGRDSGRSLPVAAAGANGRGLDPSRSARPPSLMKAALTCQMAFAPLQPELLRAFHAPITGFITLSTAALLTGSRTARATGPIRVDRSQMRRRASRGMR